MILELRGDAPPLYGLDGKTVGARIPDVPWLLDLISMLGKPLVTTSANISSRIPADRVSDLDPELMSEVDLLLSWQGQLSGSPSTVFSILDESLIILREGTISTDIIQSKYPL